MVPVTALLLASLVARAADGPLVLMLDVLVLVLVQAVCGDGHACSAVLHKAAAGLMLRCGREMRRRGRSNGCEWAPWAGSGWRAAGSNGR